MLYPCLPKKKKDNNIINILGCSLFDDCLNHYYCKISIDFWCMCTSNPKSSIIIARILLPPSYLFCFLFHFEMSQNIVMFLKIKVINLLMFLLYPY